MLRTTKILLFVISAVALALLGQFLFTYYTDTQYYSSVSREQPAAIGGVREHSISSGDYNDSSTTLIPPGKNTENWRDQISQEIDQLMRTNRWDDAVSVIDNVYQQADTQELEFFKTQVINHAIYLADNHDDVHASALLSAYTKIFDDVDAWRELGGSAARLSDWNTAVDAYLGASLLEYQPEALENLMQAVIRSAAHVRASLEQQSDQLGVLHLYQRLYDQHPDYARFQLELAQSFLRLGDDASAVPLLEVLQYDSELGTLGKQKLATIAQRNEKLAVTRQQKNPEQQTANTRRSDIVVPLIRSGNSFTLNINVNSRSVRMLLDTGASITALSTNLISTLNLEPTGRYIQLTTANGVRRSQLFQSTSLQIGRLKMQNLVVAEIDLGRSHGVQGLLGTDVLNRIDTRFSYIIDNQANSLIFRRK